MNSEPGESPAVPRPCIRCAEESAVIVPGMPGMGTVAVCAEHLEWAFLSDVGEWLGRRRAV